MVEVNFIMLRLSLALLVAISGIGMSPLTAQGPQPASSAFERFKAMEGEWIDVTGAFGKKGALVATYKVTGAGNTVVESFPIGTPHEMTTVYHRDGTAMVLTHYCAGGNQPRLRAKEISGNVIEFAFEGGSNIDVAKTSHMHNMRWEFVSNDEIKSQWYNWSNGKADGTVNSMQLQRKK